MWVNRLAEKKITKERERERERERDIKEEKRKKSLCEREWVREIAEKKRERLAVTDCVVCVFLWLCVSACTCVFVESIYCEKVDKKSPKIRVVEVVPA